MQPDLTLDIAAAESMDDVAAITSLYPGKTPAEREEMVRRSLRPEFVEMTEERRVILLARQGGEIVGTVQVVWEHPGDTSGLMMPGAAMIHHVRTHPDWQGWGIGRRMLEVAEDLAQQRGLAHVTLGVEPDNTRALRLYQWMGYEERHRYRGAEGEEIIAMRKALPG
jgi:ribosomal protein S18 acetylase RimI-like enzyme